LRVGLARHPRALSRAGVRVDIDDAITAKVYEDPQPADLSERSWIHPAAYGYRQSPVFGPSAGIST